MTRFNNQAHSRRVSLRRKSQAGVALVAALLLLLVITAMAVTLMYTVNTEQHLQRTDSANNLAYYAAESGMEKMMSDLDNLYASNPSPAPGQITAVASAANQPVLPGVAFPEYTITMLPPPVPGPNNAELLSSGPNAGLMATVQPLTLTVTAVRPGGEQARLSSTVQVAQIPIFQFGAFSQTDMSYFPGQNFDAYGRIQANGNLFIMSGNTLTFHDQIRSAGDVIRDQLPNGVAATTGSWTGLVLAPTAPGVCDVLPPASPPATCRPLRLSGPVEESATGGPVSKNGGIGNANPQWQAVSQQTYNSMILSGSTGAQQLTFPISDAAQIIRRAPLVGESATSALGASRLYNQAQIRVLLVDDPADLRNGANDPGNIRLANWRNPNGLDYANGVPVGAPGTRCHHNNTCTYFAEGTTDPVGPAPQAPDPGWSSPPVADAQNHHAPDASNPPEAPFVPNNGGANWSLIDGWLRVEIKRPDGTWVPVTREWLELGFARGFLPPGAPGANAVNPNAILIVQELADRNGNDNPTEAQILGIGANAGPGSQTNWYPINMYDVREAEFREATPPTCKIGGVLNLVEIDVANLQRWLQGITGATGNQVDYLQQNGYLLYFSDRRGMLPNVDAAQTIKTGKYGFEDVVNPSDGQGAPNRRLDAGEDIDGDGVLETYGGENLGLGFARDGIAQPQVPNTPFQEPNTLVDCVHTGRENWISGARHALRLVDGGLGNLPFRPDNNGGGFTVASENPVYILGNYNSNGAFADGDGHVSAAVIADAVTLLSNGAPDPLSLTGWLDFRSFRIRTSTNGRKAVNTSYRVAVAAGRSMNFPYASVAGNFSPDFGTDGGMQNFLHLLEDWGSATVSYRGSMVSPFYSQYATGTFKCCSMAYFTSRNSRNYSFDTDFQDIKKMPPGTPVLRNVINQGFKQVFN